MKKPERLDMNVATFTVCDGVQEAIDQFVDGDEDVAGYVVALLLRDGSCVTGANAVSVKLSETLHSASRDIAHAINVALMRSQQ